ncbi:hypothetical protein AUJ68_02415 [Candidatus Woesearchaeota archaeon CG1_02_57_44]|nr:MAG: hypothetical protein AUJ68_02415 [Candidatus Woesearchaeota archaeon CG1_02_57_44]
MGRVGKGNAAMAVLVAVLAMALLGVALADGPPSINQLPVKAHVLLSNGSNATGASYNVTVYYNGSSTVLDARAGTLPTGGGSIYHFSLNLNYSAENDTVILVVNTSFPYQRNQSNYTITAADVSNGYAIMLNLTLFNFPPAQVAGLAVASVAGQTQLNVSWSASSESDLALYRVYRSQSNFSSTASASNIANTTDDNYTDSGLTSDATYWYAIAPQDAEGNYNASVIPVAGVVADVLAPESVANLSASVSASTITLTWSAVTSNNDSTSTADVMGYMLYMANTTTPNATSPPQVPSNWVNIANTSNATLTHDHTGLTGYTYYFQVFAYDDAGHISRNSTQVNGSITTLSSSINLSAGWNLFSLPLQPSASGAQTILTGLNYTVLYWWNTSRQGWQSSTYLSGLGILDGELQVLEIGKGYWIKMLSPGTLTVSGTQQSQNVSLVATWTMVGYSQASSATVSSVFADVSGYVSLWRYNTSSSSWETNIKILGSFDGFADVEPGVGYWIRTSQNDSWSYG